MEKIAGSLEHIIYRNEENGYTIAKLVSEADNEIITVVGTLQGVQLGEYLHCKGRWRVDKRFGRQFVLERFDAQAPSSLAGIKKYLASGAVAGIGSIYAAKIVQHFGVDTLTVLDLAPQRLLEVEGIGKKKLARIQDSWAKQKDIRQVMIFLQQQGLSPTYAQRIFKVFGQQSIQKVKEDPYRLASAIDGIGFKKADLVAQNLGLDRDAPKRIAAGIEFALEQMARMGHSCYPLEQLVQEAAMLLGVAFEAVENALDELVVAGRVLVQLLSLPNQKSQPFVWSKLYYKQEQQIAEELERLQLFESSITLDTWEDALEKATKKEGITLAEQQEAAVVASLQEKIHLITGGPGTGKSTITKIIVEILHDAKASVLLAAPTGRAAKRLSEITKREASTIHSLLTFDFVTRYFRKNEHDRLECDVLIVDEASMIDAFLMSALLRALPDQARLILIGDVDQLPSVGAGNVLHDLMQSNQFKVTRLTEIFRQAVNSKIVTNAHKINQGIFPNLQTEESSDFFFITEPQPERIIQHVIGLIKKRLPKAYGWHALKDIQLLCPMNKGNIGTVAFNKALQETLNPKKTDEKAGVGPRQLVEGDKVLQTRNNYDKGVYNGDIGFVKKILTVDKLLQVDFDGTMVEYDFAELNELELAYAVSVHKYQGSESPCIILPIHESYRRLLFRNLLYTGITRGKRLVILVGTRSALNAAIKNNKAHKRYTGLAQRLLQKNKGLPPIKIVPMLGAEGYEDWVAENF